MEISLIVDGLPPAKDGSRSIFNPANSHRRRVDVLLKKVRQTLEGSPRWNRTEKRHVGLELIIETPNELRGDAINFLGGVADVLQANRRGIPRSYLGDLNQETLYHDDRQISEVRYSVEQGDSTCYRVRVWVLRS